MKKNCDVLIIGSGIIGCCLALELCKMNYQTLNVDFQPTAGAGSTANSCGNVRFYYSTYNGVATAYESAWYWHNWKKYIGVTDPRGTAKYHNTGSVFIKNQVIDWPKSTVWRGGSLTCRFPTGLRASWIYMTSVMIGFPFMTNRI